MIAIYFEGFSPRKYKGKDEKSGVDELSYDSFLPPSMTMCLRGRIFISRLGAAQASNLTGKVLDEFSAQLLLC